MFVVVALLGAGFLTAMAQDQQRGGRDLPLTDNVFGKVTAVSRDSLTIAPATGGDAVTVKVGENTRISKQRQPVKLDEIKANDTIFARGKLNGNVMEASAVGVVNPEMAQRFQGGQAGMMSGFNREDLGKKFIMGEVRAIQETKLTIARMDGQTQEIEVDENTSFRKGEESITLPDIKVGDFVRGPGEVKDNVFVAKELIVGRLQIRRMRGGPEGETPTQNKPDGSAPPNAAPPSPPK
jgi:hypothetical protein